MQLFREEPMWAQPELLPAYDIVIVGGGAHGLALAYYLAKRGLRNIAVLERNYIGSGGSSRSTALIRADYRTPEAIRFYKHSLALYEALSIELGFNLLFSQQGRLTLAHSKPVVASLRERMEANRLHEVETVWLGRDEIRRLVPDVDLGADTRFPILGGMFHPPAGFIRHDAVVWAYGRAASRLGVAIHPKTEVLEIEVCQGRVAGLTTNRGQVRCGLVVNATAGWCSTIGQMVGLDLPIITHTLQACVTEALKPFLNTVVVSDDLHVYFYQTPRGEVVIGGQSEPYASYSQGSSLDALETMAAHAVQVMPMLAQARILRQWAGLCDMTPDMCPLLGPVEAVPGFVLDCGWGTYGFKAVPAAGSLLAQYIETGRMPDLIAPFTVARFETGALVDEQGSAASGVSH